MENKLEFVVLVVDDDELTRSLMVNLLGLRGYTVFSASNSLDSLELLRSTQRIDLLATDVRMMGGLNGEDLVKAARAIRPDLKVLFVTGYAEDLNLDWTAQAQIMQKPVSLNALLQKVSSMLGGPPGAGGMQQ